MEDKLREEYDLKTLKVRKMGVKRKKFGDNIIKLDSDVAEVFSNAESVNEALKKIKIKLYFEYDRFF